MEPINKDNIDSREPVGARVVNKTNSVKRKVAIGILNNTGIIVGFFLLFVVVVVFTTDINITSFEVIAKLGLTFFVLLFCSYSMYVNFSDSGIRAGRQSEAYAAAIAAYDHLKKTVIEKQQQARLTEFCKHYIEVELKATRSGILADVGIKYERYVEEFIGKDKKTLQADTSLSKAQVAAIIKAGNAKPIRLTPEMILKRGRGSGGRAPLGQKPETKRKVRYIIKFCTTLLTSLLTGIIVFDIIETPTWATFAAVCMKILPILLNGFMGYKMGYENIAVDTVNYTNDQADLLQQFLQYIAAVPEPVEVVDEEKKPEESAAQQVTVKLTSQSENAEIA